VQKGAIEAVVEFSQVLKLAQVRSSKSVLELISGSELRSLVFRSRSHRFSSFGVVVRLLMIGLGKF